LKDFCRSRDPWPPWHRRERNLSGQMHARKASKS
jgi:hypothetical protein